MKFMVIIIIVTIAVFWNVIATSSAMEINGQWDYGACFDIVASGNYLYVGVGGQVRIYDISTKEKIENIGFQMVRSYNGYADVGTYKEKTPPVNILHTNSGTIKGLYINGSYLYIIGDKKFVIADISDPPNAYIVSSLAIGGEDVQVRGNYAYVTSGGGIKIIDVTDKTSPNIISEINPGESVRRLYIYGDYLLTGGNNIYLYIYDITNLTHPSLIGTWADPNNDIRRSVSSVAAYGNYVYVVEYHYGLYVLNISDPTNPVLVNSIIGLHNPNANDIKIFGNYLFLSTRYEGFRVYNISDPENPVEISRFSGFAGYTEGIFVHQMSYGLYVFEGGYSYGWVIVNVTNLSSPTLLTQPKMFVADIDTVAVKGNYAFYGGHNDGIWVVNVSDPSNPKEVIFIRNKGRNSGLLVDGDYLYVAGSWSALTIVNISNPEDPIITAWNYGPSIGGKMVVIGNILYVSGLNIYNVSDKSNPVLVYSGNEGVTPLAKYGDNYLVCGNRSGLYIFDISKRTDPHIVGNYSINMYTGDAEMLGDVVYAVPANGDLYSIDISDPSNPRLIGKTSGIKANQVELYGTIAYVAPRIESWGGLRAVNITDPSNLTVIETLSGISAGPNGEGMKLQPDTGLLFTSSRYIISVAGGEIPLMVSSIKVSSITQNSAIISWITNKEADSLVEYGTESGNYTFQVYNSNITKYHVVEVGNLNLGTTYYFVVTSTDANGNSAESGEYCFTTLSDTTKPTTTYSITPTSNQQGWLTQPVTITFFRSDDVGVAYTNYSFNPNGPWTEVEGSDPFNVTVTKEGETTIWFYSVDVNGNVEDMKNLTVRINYSASGEINSTEIEISPLLFGDIISSDNYYYVTNNGSASVAEGGNAENIVPFVVLNGTKTIQISLGQNKLLPQNTFIYLDDDTTPNSDDQNMVVIRGNSSNRAEIVGNSSITAEKLYVFLKTGETGDFKVDVVVTI